MTTYLIRHPGSPRDDILVEGNDLTLDFTGGWAIFTDPAGVHLAVSARHAGTIERVDPEQDAAPDDTQR